jgi:hypothetical protein
MRLYFIKSKITLLLFVLCLFTLNELKAQDIIMYKSSLSINEYLNQKNLNFQEIQAFFVNDLNGDYSIINGEAMGIQQSSSRHIVIFYNNQDFDFSKLSILKNATESFN